MSNKKNGNGILYFANGDKRVGVWKDDKQIAEFFGHTARIWKMEQIETQDSRTMQIASVSEDASCRVW